MKIQELERQVGIERATIRYYEKEGLIAPERMENGYRNYSEHDARELQRIKLLRELGVSLDTIRKLQQGTEDFAAVMRRQCAILQGRQQQTERARAVCERISADGMTYAELDTVRYQSLLDAPQLPSPVQQGSGGAVFQEREYREPHPWRRLFARLVDHQIIAICLWFIVVVILRWRPVTGLMTFLVNYAAWFAMMPAEAAWLHFFAATPGKWLFGIRVEAVEGGTLYYSDALTRAWKVFHAGMGFNVIGLNLYCMFKGYKDHTRYWDTDWDADCEVSFRKFSWINIVLVTALAVLLVFADNCIGKDAWMPKFRSSNPVVAQYADNYNHFNQVIWEGALQSMDREGGIIEPGYTTTIGYHELEYDPYGQFEYELDGKTIRSITFHHTWYEENWLTELAEPDEPLDRFGYWAPSYIQLAVIAACSCQDGIDHDGLNQLIADMVDDFGQPCSDGYTGIYGDITCTWDLDLELYHDNDEETGQADIYEVTLDLKIEFAK